jgi:hypothetical protein
MCMHGDSEVSKKKAKFRCAKCGATTLKKGHACKPEKVAGGGAEKKKKDGKKKKKDNGKKTKSSKKKK